MNIDTTTKKRSMIIPAIVCAVVASASAVNGNVTSIFSGMWLTSSLFASSIIASPSLWLTAIPVAVFVSVLAFTHSPLTAMMSVVFALCGAVCAECIMKKETKRSASLKSVIPAAASGLVIFVFTVVQRTGSFSAQSIRDFYSLIVSDYIELAPAGVTADFFTENSVFLPGLLIAFLGFTGILCASMTKLTLDIAGYGEDVFEFDRRWELKFSAVSAILYAAVFFMIFFEAVDGTGASDAFYASVYTLYYPLSLAMLLTGTKTVCRFIGRTPRKLILAYCGVIVLLILAFLLKSSFPTVIICGVGVFKTIKSLSDRRSN